MTPLAISPLGKPVQIAHTPTDASFKRRLESLGLTAGSAVTPIADNGGDLIVRVGASRIALNRALAMRIGVK